MTRPRVLAILSGVRAPCTALLALVALACDPPATNQPIAAAAAELFGLEITEVGSTEGHVRMIEDCAWERGVLVPPEGTVRIRVRRGAHTLMGKAAICDGRAPGRFAVRLVEPERKLELLELDVDAESLRRRAAEPFLLSFWAEQDGELQLKTTRGPDDAHLAWLGVALRSRLAPPTGVPARLAAETRFADKSPGRRARRDPLERNAQGRYWLGDFGWDASSSSWGPIEIDRSNGSEAGSDGAQISVGGRKFERGVGVHAPSAILVKLGGACQKFTAGVGVDDGGGPTGSVLFRVFGDQATLFESTTLRSGDPPVRVEVDLDGRSWLRLEVETAGDGPEGDWADWIEAELTCEDG